MLPAELYRMAKKCGITMRLVDPADPAVRGPITGVADPVHDDVDDTIPRGEPGVSADWKIRLEGPTDKIAFLRPHVRRNKPAMVDYLLLIELEGDLTPEDKATIEIANCMGLNDIGVRDIRPVIRKCLSAPYRWSPGDEDAGNNKPDAGRSGPTYPLVSPGAAGRGGCREGGQPAPTTTEPPILAGPPGNWLHVRAGTDGERSDLVRSYAIPDWANEYRITTARRPTWRAIPNHWRPKTPNGSGNSASTVRVSDPKGA